MNLLEVNSICKTYGEGETAGIMTDFGRCGE